MSLNPGAGTSPVEKEPGILALILRCIGYSILGLLTAFLTLAGFGGVGPFFLLLGIAYLGWVVFAMLHYRYVRQEEIHFLLQAVTVAGQPLSPALGAFLQGRRYSCLGRARTPLLYALVVVYILMVVSVGVLWSLDPDHDNGLMVILGFLSLAVFFLHGVYLLANQRVKFDQKIERLKSDLEAGVSLSDSLKNHPGVLSREAQLAVSLGEPTGNLGLCLEKIPTWNQDYFWIDTMPRLAYAFAVVLFTLAISIFQTIFIVPKFQKIYSEFQAKMPLPSEWFFRTARLIGEFWFLLIPLAGMAFSLMLLPVFFTRVRWSFPLVGRLYRIHVQGNFLRMLGVSMLTQEVLPKALGFLRGSGYFPRPGVAQIDDFNSRLEKGEPLPASLYQAGLIPSHMVPLVESSQKVGNLPWALSEAGSQRSRLAYLITQRLTFTVFPVILLLLGLLVGFIAIAMFLPLVELIVWLT